MADQCRGLFSSILAAVGAVLWIVTDLRISRLPLESSSSSVLPLVDEHRRQSSESIYLRFRGAQRIKGFNNQFEVGVAHDRRAHYGSA